MFKNVEYIDLVSFFYLIISNVIYWQKNNVYIIVSFETIVILNLSGCYPELIFNTYYFIVLFLEFYLYVNLSFIIKI